MNKTKCYNCNIEYYSKTGFQFEKCNHTFCPFCLSAKFMSSLSVNYNAAFPRAKIKCSCCSKNAIDLSISNLNDKLKQFKLSHYDNSKNCLIHDNKKYNFWCKTCKSSLCDICVKEHNNEHKILSTKKFEEKIKTKIDKMKYKSFDELTSLILSSKFDVEKNQRNMTKNVIEKIDCVIEIFQKIKNNLLTQFENENCFYSVLEKLYEYFYFHLEHIQLYNFTKLINFEFENVSIEYKQRELTLIDYLYKATKEKMYNYFEGEKDKQNFTFTFLEYNNKLNPYQVKFPLITKSLYSLSQSIPLSPMTPCSLIQLSNSYILLGLVYNNIEHLYTYSPLSFKLLHSQNGEQNSKPYPILEIPSLSILLSGSPTSSSIKVWSLNFTHKKYIQSFKAHLTPVTALYQISNSDIVLSGSKDGEIILWDINQMKQIQIFKPHVDAITSIIEVSFVNKIASASQDCYIKLYDKEEKENKITIKEDFSLFKLFGKINKIIQIKQSSYIASCDSLGEVSIWDIAKKVNLFSLRVNKGSINDIVVINSIDKLITCSSFDKTMKVCNLINSNTLNISKEYPSLTGIVALLLLKDKRLISIGNDLLVWSQD